MIIINRRFIVIKSQKANFIYLLSEMSENTDV